MLNCKIHFFCYAHLFLKNFNPNLQFRLIHKEMAHNGEYTTSSDIDENDEEEFSHYEMPVATQNRYIQPNTIYEV